MVELEAVVRELGRDPPEHELAELVVVGGEVEDRDARARDDRAEAGDDDVAELVADLVDGEVAVGADDLAQEHGRVLDPDRVGAEGAQAHRAELGVARDHRVLGAPFQVGEPRVLQK